MEKRRVRRKKDSFGAERNRLQANHFLEWNFVSFFSIFKWLLIWKMLSTESYLRFSCPELVSYKLAAYKKEFIETLNDKREVIYV